MKNLIIDFKEKQELIKTFKKNKSKFIKIKLSDQLWLDSHLRKSLKKGTIGYLDVEHLRGTKYIYKVPCSEYAGNSQPLVLFTSNQSIDDMLFEYLDIYNKNVKEITIEQALSKIK